MTVGHLRISPQTRERVLRGGDGGAQAYPFQSRRETGTTSTPQAGGLDLVDNPIVSLQYDLLGLVPVSHLLCMFQIRRVPAVQVLEDAVLVLETAVVSLGSAILDGSKGSRLRRGEDPRERLCRCLGWRCGSRQHFASGGCSIEQRRRLNCPTASSMDEAVGRWIVEGQRRISGAGADWLAFPSLATRATAASQSRGSCQRTTVLNQATEYSVAYFRRS